MILCLVEAKAQSTNWHLLATIPVVGLDQISLDNKGNVFYSDKSGNVVKLDSKCIKAGEYSPVVQSKLDQLEAFYTLNIFLFSADLQQFVLLDVYLNPLATVSLQHEKTGIVKAATMGSGHVVWMVDEEDFSLVKYDYRRNVVLQDQPLALILGQVEFGVVDIIERQNMVFLHIGNEGVFLFDRQGNFIKKLNVRFSHKPSLSGDFIYFIRDGLVQRINIYSEKVENLPLPDGNFDKVLADSEKIIFYSPTEIAIYKHLK